MAGLLDGLFGKTPTPPAQVALDPNAQNLLNQGVDRANAPTQAFADSANQGVDDYSTSIGGGTTNNFGGNSNSDSNMEAIKNAYRSQATKQIGDLKQRNSWQADNTKNQYMSQISTAVQGQQRAATQQYETLTGIYNQQEQARAQFVNQLFQTANYGIGVNAARSKTPSAMGGQSSAQNMAGGYGDAGGGGQPDISNLA